MSFLRAGLLEQIPISLVPVLLGEGVRLFDHGSEQRRLEKLAVINSPTRTDLRYRVARAES